LTTHPIVHVEIPATDLKEAAQFYSEVFGWEFDHSMDFYPMFKADGGPGGGFVKLSDVSHSVGIPLLFLGTDDIEASLADVEAHGGKTLMPKTEIGEHAAHGWWAVFTDPVGNRIALYTSPQQVS
jgi:predicted enzyme related to lactoylglutathione lyase